MHNQFNYYEPDYDDDEAQYTEGQSEMLVEELDPNYEPTRSEIEQYALEVLGMVLPEDQPLLYLAKQALKAPMPESWNAFQSPNQEVYYKHKVTQQKSYEHPIDIQYRKKYEQEKEKAARKTLKSKVALKNLPGTQLGVPSMKIPGMKNESLMDSPFLKNQSFHANYEFKQDPQIIKKYEKQTDELESNLKNRLSNLKRTQEQSFAGYERRSRNNHNEEVDRLKKEGQTQISIEERLRSQKIRISNQMDRQFQGNLKRQKLSIQTTFERDLKNGDSQFETNFNKKLFDDESQYQRRIQEKSKELQKCKQQIERQKASLIAKNKSQILQIKKSMQNSESSEINKELENRIRKISFQVQARLKNRSNQLEEQFQKISKMMKGSPEDRVQEIFTQKINLQQISNKKIQMSRLKQKKLIQNQLSTQLLQKQNNVRKNKQSQFLKDVKEIEYKLENKERDVLETKKKEYDHKWKQLESKTYERFREKVQDFELKKNKNIISIRQSFIKEIEGKTNNIELESSFHTVKLQIKEKRFEIQNKNKQIQNIKREIANMDKKHQKVMFNWKIYRSKNTDDINSLLKKKLDEKKIQIRNFSKYQGSELESNYINQAMSEHLEQLKQAKKQLESDKNLLSKVFKHLQSNTVLPSYQKRKAADSMNYSSKMQSMNFAASELLKKYNQDVRLMRENAQSIQEFEHLIDQVKLDDEYLEQLEQYQLKYMVPALRQQLSSFSLPEKAKPSGDLGSSTGYNLKEVGGHNTDLVSTKKVRQMFNEHSKFLSGVKNELNSKLSEIRSMNHLF